MKTYKLGWPAPGDTRFDPDAAEALVGTSMMFEGQEAKIVEARVVKGGRMMHVTVEVPMSVTALHESAATYSID